MCDSHRKKQKKKTRVHAVAIKVTRLDANATRKRKTHLTCLRFVPYINYCLKSVVSIMLLCWLFSTCYTAVRIKNCLKSTSAIKIATMKNTDIFHYEGKPSCDIA